MSTKLGRYNKKLPYSYTLGVFPTLELLNNKRGEVVKIVLSGRGDDNEGVAQIKKICNENGVHYEYNDRLIKVISEKENTYALGVFNKYDSPIDFSQNHLVLVHPSDMGNLGTIIRTMIAFDVKNLALIIPASDIFDPKTIRASMGAIFKVKVEYFETFEAYTKKAGGARNLYPFVSSNGSLVRDVTFNKPYSLVFGSEGAGLSEEYYKIGVPVTIPQTSNVDSLNLSVATGIGLYFSNTH